MEKIKIFLKSFLAALVILLISTCLVDKYTSLLLTSFSFYLAILHYYHKVKLRQVNEFRISRSKTKGSQVSNQRIAKLNYFLAYTLATVNIFGIINYILKINEGAWNEALSWPLSLLVIILLIISNYGLSHIKKIFIASILALIVLLVISFIVNLWIAIPFAVGTFIAAHLGYILPYQENKEDFYKKISLYALVATIIGFIFLLNQIFKIYWFDWMIALSWPLIVATRLIFVPESFEKAMLME